MTSSGVHLSDEHFSDQQWADFVRGLSTAPQQSAMQTHLDSGCARCAETVRLLRVVSASAAAWTSVPEHLTAAARAVFEPGSAERGWIEKLTPLIATLAFGPSLDWQPAGVRGRALEGHRAVFRAGDYSVDLSLEAVEALERREMVGQISHELDPEQRLEGVIVQVLVAGRTVGETATNRFGEFMIECPEKDSVILRLALKHQGHRIDLPIRSQF